MRPVVVQDQVDLQRLRSVLVDGVAELAKLATAMAPVAFPDDGSGLHVQGR